MDVDEARVCLDGEGVAPVCVEHGGGAPVHFAARGGTTRGWIMVGSSGEAWIGDDHGARTLETPALSGELRDVAMSQDMEAVLLDGRAVHVLRGDEWRSVEVRASEPSHLRTLLVTAGGRVFVGGTEGRLWELHRGRLDALGYGGIDPEVRRGTVEGMWWSSSQQALYLRMSSGRIVEVEVQAGVARAYDLPNGVAAADPEGTVWGIERVSGPSVFSTHGREVFELVDGQLWPRGRGGESVLALRQNVGLDRLEGLTTRGWEVLEPVETGSLARIPLTEQERIRVDRAASRRGPPAIVREGRLVPDLGVRFGGLSRETDANRQPVFAMDVDGGVLVSPWRSERTSRGLWLWPRAGYSLRTWADVVSHGVHGDLGLGYGGALWSAFVHGGAGWSPVTATPWTGRVSVGSYILWGTVGVELRVEEIDTDGEASVGGMLSLNLAPLFWFGTL